MNEKQFIFMNALLLTIYTTINSMEQHRQFPEYTMSEDSKEEKIEFPHVNEMKKDDADDLQKRAHEFIGQAKSLKKEMERKNCKLCCCAGCIAGYLIKYYVCCGCLAFKCCS